jgi:transcriptional antiterminator NusG
VGDFIGSAGKPSPMAQADVDKMLMQVEKAQDGGPVSVEFAKNDLVKIKEGAFENFEGAVDEVLAEKGLVRVVVTIFGRATPVELEYWQIEKV